MWDALHGLWRVTTLKRQAFCRRIPTGDALAIEKRTDRASYSGLQTCGSRWTCPACAPKIAAERAADVALALGTHHLAGGRVAFVTLTTPHGARDSLAGLLDDLGAAWTAIRQDKRFRRLYEAHGAGWIKRVDVTHGEHGWHPHLHVLLFLPAGTTDDQAQALGEAMIGPWASKLARAGRGKLHDEHGVRVQLLDLHQAHEAIAGYVSATEYAAGAGHADLPDEAATRRASYEIASGTTKRARGGNRTPMQLLADLVATGEARDVALWREYEQATRRRAQLLWSDGLRSELLGDVEELTDDQAAASNDGQARLLAVIRATTWAVVRRRPGAPAAVLEAAESDDDDDQAREEVAQLLHELGAGPLPDLRRELLDAAALAALPAARGTPPP